ncbi:hypothetical protein P280DRAFT_476771 [Massarina eburnea CBS 473.64]|uniref:CorA-like transporter domain-containing protein n=1 Tax=Massarina eburnea CBS 473.64 TaxID=1395130 RepID=A0A6A6SED3_9PLEO|nr:hypothetical protein P280DRAFT_476771 [Massarina eburnea CBS 473.64]
MAAAMAYQSERVQNLGDLKEHLREALHEDNAEPLTRFIFIHARHSRAFLRISYPMICFLFSYLQVMPAFLDFIFPFGDQEHAQDSYFAGFKEECYLGAQHRGLKLPQLGRSGSEMRLCFNLRSIEESPRQIGLPWSIRQVAVYHTFDFETAKSVWVTVKGNMEIKDRITELVNSNPSRVKTVGDAFAETLRVYLLLCNWALENWRWYINDLEKSVQSSTQTALSAVIERPPSPPRRAASLASWGSPPTSPRSDSGIFSLSRSSTFASLMSPISKQQALSTSSTTHPRTFSTISQAPTVTDEDSYQSRPMAQHGSLITIRKALSSLIRRLSHPRVSRAEDLEAGISNENPQSHFTIPGVRAEPPVTSSSNGDEDQTTEKFAFADLQHILFTEQKAQEAAEMIQMNLGVLEELRQQYVYVVEHKDCPQDIRDKCDISRFGKSIRGMEKELRLQHSRFETFHRLLSEHKALLNSILQFRGMEASIRFSKRAHESAVKMEAMTSNMNDIAQKTRQETVSMRIITLVTLFFLPGTFIGVSFDPTLQHLPNITKAAIQTFFSAGIVKFDDSAQTFYPQGLKLFLAICVPLMVITFVAWYFVYRSVDRGQKKLDTDANCPGLA